MGKTEVGHNFLARLGKKRLRPGGIAATNWLINQANLTTETKVLEVACNMCTTSIELAGKYKCHITAVDMDSKALEKARKNIEQNQLQDFITVQQANAMKLPFENESFDVVFNEAMLTMFNQSAKKKAISEYYRVLKPGGVLLTHDIMLTKGTPDRLVDTLRDIISVNVSPLPIEDWENTFKGIGFSEVRTNSGAMSLMNPKGMIRDEGLLGMLTIVKNGLKKENRNKFKQMFQFFNKSGKSLNYIVVCSKKAG
ncbi:class I SAM-dependent methyltransferase [Bacillus sp. B1-b2]|uniref:class I SAM-dependent methyltransferase n=1 Tax=Bacillus sp. B1-b2 TaxID=2653201 RepID=UPI001261CBCE|nr:class I SAM-dependent methyltransferase [Bacillus sp. B1-b2]KAB7672068.1 class I SAM-dependent methyltransferase [Bacillus sp. B1-b2]